MCVLISGGLVALLQVLVRRNALGVLRNLTRVRTSLKQRVDAAEEQRHKHLFGYALAIALGTIWAMAGRYCPAILPL